ncbi:MAG: ABC transporter ATP-binding protein [Candidatus Edwardsbacteria bacterium]|nr:ABC transporter ATP-binding protein [Candidatus Edwardsbacteria bacterium]
MKVFQQHFWTAKRNALQGLDLEVRSGEVFGFLGPNGAGKTTTIKAIVGLIRPTAGTARVFGKDPWTADAKRLIGFLPETPYFYDYLTGREFLRFCGQLFGIYSKSLESKIGGLLERVGLADQADCQMRKYSKGMLQRIGLAQALINEPELLVLDEPLTGLDPLGRKEFKDIILALKQQGKTVFFSSHILPDAETVCDRVAIISRGRLLRTGYLHELLKARIESIEFTCSGIDFRIYEQLKKLASSALEVERDFMLNFPDQSAVNEAVRIVNTAGGIVKSIVPQQESLEAYFAREVEKDEA